MSPDTPLAVVTPITERGYAHPEVLVSTDWVAAHLDDPKVRIVESDEDLSALRDRAHPRCSEDRLGHRPQRPAPARLRLPRCPGGAAALEGNLRRHHHRALRRQEQLVGGLLVLGAATLRAGQPAADGWWPPALGRRGPAAGHRCLELSAGQHRRCRPATTRPFAPSGTKCSSTCRRAGRLVDVRSPEEYRGERLHMADYPNEGALRGGHIPGARSIPVGARRRSGHALLPAGQRAAHASTSRRTASPATGRRSSTAASGSGHPTAGSR